VNFWAFILEKYLSAVPILNEYLETLVNDVNFFKLSLLVVKWALQAREEMMSDQQVPVPVPPCELILH
jgi:hypothetical protein